MKIIKSHILKTTFFTILFSLSFLSNGITSTPHIRHYNSFHDLQRGKAEGVSVTHLGELKLSPQLKRIMDTGDPFVWCVAEDSKKNLYIGTGNDGRVYRKSSKGDSTIFFDAPELEIYCLAVDKQDNVYVGTFPNGKIYRVTLDGKSTVFADPPDTYIWAMKFDPKGNLFVATGKKGRIYKIDRQGRMDTFFESEETHIRSLEIDSQDRIYAGSGGNGYVYSFSKTGEAFVLYDSPMREVHQLFVAGNGTLYAAGMGEEGTSMPIFPESATQPTKAAGKKEQTEEGTNEISLVPQALSPAKLMGLATERSAIYRIDKDGAARDIWDSDTDRVQCFIAQNDNELLVGTSVKGRIILLNTDAEQSVIVDLEETQISFLHQSTTGEIYIGTSNMGRLYTLGPKKNHTGAYISETFDARVLAQWGKIDWDENSKGNGKIRFYTRSGNTEEPGQTWSSWSQPYTKPYGENITSPPARFIQWKCELKGSGDNTPIVEGISFAYLQKNLSPIINSVNIHRQGDYYPSSLNQTSSQRNSDLREGIVFPQPLGKGEKRKGYLGVDWMFEDPNSDALQFNLYYKPERSLYWTELAKELSTSVYSWDTAQMPNGIYLIKVEATDRPSNPESLALKTSKISKPFIVDNIGPKVFDLVAKFRKDKLYITFKVADDWSIIRKVDLSINAQGWEVVYPADGICDSLNEEFEILVSAPQEKMNTIAVRATDDNDNTGFSTTIVERK